MIPIDSTVEGIQLTLGKCQSILSPEGFDLGGGYQYDHGYFDHALDWEEEHGHRYYLRIPVYAVSGDIEMGREETLVTLGKPFVIKHEFRTGNDPSGDIGVISAAVNQFSKPIPTGDAEIDQRWIKRARQLIARIEPKLT
ncbi:YugN family protein [Laceyella putida]|uniref:YugN family protein n=1 Tax=Laceyella putida TaxID=110101 RepID=A0ABW2RNF6_9BACL